MYLLIVAENHRETLENALLPMAEKGWRWQIVHCTKDAQEFINVIPVDAVIVEFTFCEDAFVAQIRQHHAHLPVIVAVDDPFMEAFRSHHQLSRSSLLPLSEAPAQLPVFVQRALSEQLQGGRSMSCVTDERRFEFSLDNDKARISPTVQSLLDVCESMGICTEATRFRIGIALEEALVNAIVHGNLEVSSKLRELGDDSYENLILQRQQQAKYSQRRVHFTCRITSREARFVIRDQGQGFDVSSLPDPTDPEYLERPCGRGLLLMRSFMSEVRYNDKGNECTMVCQKPATETPASSEAVAAEA